MTYVVFDLLGAGGYDLRGAAARSCARRCSQRILPARRPAALRRSHPERRARRCSRRSWRAASRASSRRRRTRRTSSKRSRRLAQDQGRSRGRLRGVRLHAAEGLAHRPRRAAPVRVGRRALGVGRQGRHGLRRQAARGADEGAVAKPTLEADVPAARGSSDARVGRARARRAGALSRVAGRFVAAVPGVRAAAPRQAAARLRDADAPHRRRRAPKRARADGESLEIVARSRTSRSRELRLTRARQGVLEGREHHEGRSDRVLPRDRAAPAALPQGSADGAAPLPRRHRRRDVLSEGHAATGSPPWLRTTTLWSEHSQREIHYVLLDDADGLAFVANLALDPDPRVGEPRSRDLERPDWTIVDLDPKNAPREHVVPLALAIHELCEDVGLPNYVKTSGQTRPPRADPARRAVHVRSGADARVSDRPHHRAPASRHGDDQPQPGRARRPRLPRLGTERARPAARRAVQRAPGRRRAPVSMPLSGTRSCPASIRAVQPAQRARAHHARGRRSGAAGAHRATRSREPR